LLWQGIDYIAELCRNGYNGVLSIEHEDNVFGREEGFNKGKNYLGMFI
jgi:sugar phosphate isomerase/epimerase